MITRQFEYPKNAYYGRKIPKHKLYEVGKISNGLRYKFVEQVEKISWEYKLSPETVNLPSTPEVPEIQIIYLHLKKIDFSGDIVRAVDDIIPYPTLFELIYEGLSMSCIAYKRPSEADKQKWVIDGHYYKSEWMKIDGERNVLPPSVNMENLYQRLLIEYITKPHRDNEPFKAYIQRMETVRSKEQEVLNLETRMEKEKQFNQKVELNRKIRSLKSEIENLLK